MRIESEIKLDFSDVLIKPKRSTLGSRKEVDLNRFYEFRKALFHKSEIVGSGFSAEISINKSPRLFRPDH